MTSLVTRCPQCRAAFRVVAEQLHLRNGKVRCGVCKAVFDARAHQEPLPEPAVPQAPAAPARTPVVAGPPPAASEPLPSGPSLPPEASQPGVRPAPPEVAAGEPPLAPTGPHAAAQDDLPAAHVEPWLSEDAIAPPVSAQAGRLREPVLGKASQPTAVTASKREPVLKPGRLPPPMPPAPAGLPERRDPMLHAPGAQQHADDDFEGDADFGEDRDFDGVDDEREAYPGQDREHVPFVASHDHEGSGHDGSDRDRPGRDRPGRARPGHTRPFLVDPDAAQPQPFQSRPSSTARPSAARPAAARPGAARPGAARPPSSEPSFTARPSVASNEDVRTHRTLREPVIGPHGHRPHEPLHGADEFVAHGPRSGYAADLRGTRRGGLASVFWSVCCVLAGLALVLQALWWWRTPIATHVPAMRPVYDAVCAGMDCRVGYVRVPGQLSIESSSIQPQALAQPSDPAQHMTLSAVLRNRAGHAQPWPAIELTLTDFANVVVVRRMLLPAEYLGPGAPEAFAASTEREIAVSLSVRGAPVSGYRLALFFP